MTGRAAYAVIGGVAGAGIAVGPILGGWATTELSWRVVFLGEVVLVLADPRRAAHAHRRPRDRNASPASTSSARSSPPRARPHRARRAPGQHLGLDPAQELAGRAVRLLPHPVRHRRRWRGALAVREVAAPPRGERHRPAGAPRAVPHHASCGRGCRRCSRRTSSSWGCSSPSRSTCSWCSASMPSRPASRCCRSRSRCSSPRSRVPAWR